MSLVQRQVSQDAAPPAEDVEVDDEETVAIRGQIHELGRLRRLVCKTLINSTNVRKQLAQHPELSDASLLSATDLPTDDDPLAPHPSNTHQNPSAIDVKHLTNMYRLAFGVTTFPFTDPSPNSLANLNGRLLGLRFDQCSRKGAFQVPYYILLKRTAAKGNQWAIHRHTIPAFIPLDALQQTYLPRQEDDDMADQSFSGNNNQSEPWEPHSPHEAPSQNLHGFVGKVRYELTSWKLRREAIDYLKEELHLVPPSPTSNENGARVPPRPALGHPLDTDHDTTADDGESTQPASIGLYGISSLEPTAFEARQARITWTDGTIGRIKISNRGLIERAVVIGESGRIRGVENLLVDGESRIENLIPKLKVLVGGA